MSPSESTTGVNATSHPTLVSGNGTEPGVNRARSKTVWIDIDNSPHVPFFLPIISELEKRGYKLILTARNLYQVSDLLQFTTCRARSSAGATASTKC